MGLVATLAAESAGTTGEELPLLHAIVLGITQGLSEFLPISSSGHLILARWLFGYNELPDDLAKTFDVALHLGTLVGAVTYFWNDLGRYVRDGFRWLVPSGRSRLAPAAAENGRMAWLLLASAIPAALVGALFEGFIEEYTGSVWLIGVMLIVFGFVLLWADRLGGRRPAERFRGQDALSMGTAQALALAPGVSRSGVTMTAGRMLRFDRDGAARLSFLMSLPIIAGAVVFKATGVVTDGLPDGLAVPFLAGIVSSAVTGWLAVWGTLKLVRTYSFTPFVVYRVVLGVVVLVLFAAGFHNT